MKQQNKRNNTRVIPKRIEEDLTVKDLIERYNNLASNNLASTTESKSQAKTNPAKQSQRTEKQEELAAEEQQDETNTAKQSQWTEKQEELAAEEQQAEIQRRLYEQEKMLRKLQAEKERLEEQIKKMPSWNKQAIKNNETPVLASGDNIAAAQASTNKASSPTLGDKNATNKTPGTSPMTSLLAAVQKVIPLNMLSFMRLR